MGKAESEEKNERRSSSSSGSIVFQMEELKTKKAFPICIFFILGNEFCERYSYYGMRTILVLYLKYYLKWDENTSTAVYHAFTVLAYLFPLVGAMIADSWLGKFKTILYLSVVYAIGMVINTLGAIGDLGDLTVHAVLSSIGLFIIAFGTGGIKPCVSAFGGDQFDADQEEYRRSFFSLFYFAINAGSLISTFVSPIIREQVQCFENDCYALAFGIPAVLMIVAIVLFVVGTKWYRIVPPQGNIFLEVSKTIGRAISNKLSTSKKERTKEHWLDYADDGTNAILIRDIKYVMNVLVLFIPLPLFWALFDQQGSRWTLQAVRMDGNVGSIYILPDQMQICNPLMIVTLIPLFEVTLYPCLRKLNINFSPLRRMTLGMILAGISFVIAAVIQMEIDVNLTQVPYNNRETSLRIINAADCDLGIVSNVYPEWNSEGDVEGSNYPLVLVPGEDTNTIERFIEPGEFSITFACLGSTSEYNEEIHLEGEEVYDFIISSKSNGGLEYLLTGHPIEKSDSGQAIVGLINTFDVKISYSFDGTTLAGEVLNNTRLDMGGFNGLGDENNFPYERNFSVQTGGLYTLVASNGDTAKPISDENFKLDQYTDIYQNDVNIFWMIPQYFVITLGEVFLSVTGLEFAYSQAPPSMKSVLTSFWLFTVSIGNIIVLIVAEARLIPKQADEYFLFAGLIGVAAILFIILAVRYEYVDESEFMDDGKEEDDRTHTKETEESMTKEDLGKTNLAYLHNTEL